MKTFLALLALFALCGCASTDDRRVPENGMRHEPREREIGGGSETPASSLKLMLFGNADHKAYLGCLNCSELASDSIWNKFGEYGSRYSNSIWNKYGEFGSRFSQYSPWNKYSVEGPVIVDQNGNFYGRFTVNRYDPQRTRIPEILTVLDTYAPEFAH